MRVFRPYASYSNCAYAAAKSDPVDVVAFDPFADRRRILRLIGQLLPEEIRRAVALVVPTEEQRTRIDDRAIALLTRVAGGIADLIIGSVKLSGDRTTIRTRVFAAHDYGTEDTRTLCCCLRRRSRSPYISMPFSKPVESASLSLYPQQPQLKR